MIASHLSDCNRKVLQNRPCQLREAAGLAQVVLIDMHCAPGDSSLIARLFDHIESKGAQSGDLVSRAHQ
jgi:hypothetical protein